jgi:putative Mn2+ efflux pump MntP
MIEVVALAFALAMDTFAASIAEGCAVRPTPRRALLLATVFGAAQALMPLIGLALGTAAGPLIADIDHWIAFALLAVIGTRMVLGGIRSNAGAAARKLLDGRMLAVVAFATSIDAAAAGMTLPLFDVAPLVACLVIGGVTFVLSFAGVMAGGRIGARLGGHAEAAGGLVLIVLGMQILAEQLAA